MQDFTARILSYFNQPGVKSIRPKELAYELDIGKRDFTRFKAAIEQLLEADKLSLGKSKQLRLKEEPGSLVGTVRRTSKGSGYFRPNDPSQLEADESLYIAPEDLKDAYS